MDALLAPPEISSAQLAAAAGDPSRLAALVEPARAADVADALCSLPLQTAARVLTSLPFETAVRVLDQPELERKPAILEQMDPARAVPLIEAMSADEQADLLRAMPIPVRGGLVQRLAPETRRQLELLLAYSPDTAGGIMTTEVVKVPADWTVARVLEHVRTVGPAKETIYAIFVVEPAGERLRHVVSLRELLAAPGDTPVGEVGTPRRPIVVAPRADRLEAARLISKYNLLALPVVDEGGHLLGIVTVDDVLDAIVQEQTADVQRLGGLEALDEPYPRISFGRMVRKRAGWLCALFLSEMLTATAMQHFEGELERAVVLTLFIPLIMSSGGNSGSQATSLIIRALALQELRLRDWWRTALRELPTGLTLGTILGAIGIVRIMLWQRFHLYDYGPHWPLIALTVGLALVGIVTFGSLAGSMLPFLLKRIGFDPASASAPFVATLVDVTGLVIYFTVALLVLHGTLLAGTAR